MKKICAPIQKTIEICPSHGEYLSMYFRGFDLWSACPTCHQENEKLKAAEDAETERINIFQRRLNQAGLSKRFADKDFDNYFTATVAQRIILEKVKNYADNFAQNLELGRCMILFGAVGNGKTHLGVSVLRSVIAQGYNARYVRAYDLYKAIKESWNGLGNKCGESEAMDDFTKPHLLVIDEVGVQFFTAAEQTLMINVIDARYNAMLPTVIISNLTPPVANNTQQATAHESRHNKPQNLEGALGKRAYDRLVENGSFMLKFHGESFRRLVQPTSRAIEV